MKLKLAKVASGEERVAPHAGAWIETYFYDPELSAGTCRTPRGCVD